MKERWETFKVKGDELLSEVRALLHEGNVRRIVVKQGERTVAEFPLTVGVVGVLAAPVLAAVAALASLLTDCTLHVSRVEPKSPPRPKKPSATALARKKTPGKRS
jgi:hypothetical protein